LRAELLKIRKADYIQAVRDFGFPVWQILWRHALPNAVRPVAVAFALGASGAVLLEAALSFLNIGTRQVDQITWGAMLHTARDHIQLYWVWLPPGLMVSLLVGALFEWSERLRHPV
jgi:peptide/nickel transport system permease protein